MNITKAFYHFPFLETVIITKKKYVEKSAINKKINTENRYVTWVP